VSALDAARAFFNREGIPFPPLPPAAMAERIEPRRPREWGAGGPPGVPLIERDAFAEWTADHWCFGLSGHQTPAVCFSARRGEVAASVQEPWGGYEWNLADAAEELRGIWAEVEAHFEAGEPGLLKRSRFEP
jgi:hypothetical protein